MAHEPVVPAAALIDEVYGELRRLAAAYVRRERANSVQATELVHEAYMRLLNDKEPQWTDRTHFLAIAAISMRRLLVERARRRHAAKRGGNDIQVTLDDGLLAAAAPDEDEALDLLALDDALRKLTAVDPGHARVVELRYFGGMTVEETAAAMGVSPATVKRHWTIARAWLLRELKGRR